MSRALVFALLLLAVTLVVASVATREPYVPWDTLAYTERPDSLELREEADRPGVLCAWSYRGGERFRWPADGPGVGLIEGERVLGVEHVPGPQLCVRIRLVPESIT